MTQKRAGFSINPDTGVLMPNEPPPDISGHVVILNANAKLPRIVDEIQLGSSDDPLDIIVVIQNWETWLENEEWRPRGRYRGNIYFREGHVAATEDLELARIELAKVAVVLADPLQGDLADAHSTLTAVAIENLNPMIHTVVELISSVNRVHLKYTKVNEVVCIGELTEKLIAQSCISPGVKNIFDHLLSARSDTTQIFTINVPPAMSGKTFREVMRLTIERDAPFVLCGFSTTNGNFGNGLPVDRITVVNPRTDSEPGKDTIMGPSDTLVAIAYKKTEIDKFFSQHNDLSN
ncbi:MAG: hypothetical protein GY854_31680 [Deltaproteobacteria bacterium]|nr:hypothetical protein [Deltaproteobacteria bacterium]